MRNIRKKIRLNYFESTIQRADSQDDEDYLIWNAKDIFDSIINRQFTNILINIEGMLVEFEPNTLHYLNTNFIGFQLSKLRDTNIPAKKRIGIQKEEIMLNDDEYIGEFVSILYDCEKHIFIIQSNKYGLTTNQINIFLTRLRWEYLEHLGQAENLANAYVIKLKPIMDSSQLNRLMNSNIVRKLKIRCADYMLDALPENTQNGLSRLRESLGVEEGITFEITLSVSNPHDKTASINIGDMQRYICDYIEVNNRNEGFKPLLEATVKEDEESAVDVINYLEPKLTNEVSISMQARTSISSELMLNAMIEKYMEVYNQIDQMIVPRNR